jgi:hypothetical protein
LHRSITRTNITTRLRITTRFRLLLRDFTFCACSSCAGVVVNECVSYENSKRHGCGIDGNARWLQDRVSRMPRRGWHVPPVDVLGLW